MKTKDHSFDSKTEFNHYLILKSWEDNGLIQNLEVHPRFPLIAYGAVRVGFYEADFSYFDITTKERLVVDVKGFETPLWKWKRKHFEAQYKTKITVVK